MGEIPRNLTLSRPSMTYPLLLLLLSFYAHYKQIIVADGLLMRFSSSDYMALIFVEITRERKRKFRSFHKTISLPETRHFLKKAGVEFLSVFFLLRGITIFQGDKN